MIETNAHYLLINGMLLFLLGLINGVVVPYFKNSRMGLSSHLAGVQNGMVLLIFGLLWPHVMLPDSVKVACYWLSLFSMYSIWLGLVLSATWGASRSTPIAGAGYSTSKNKELLVSVLIKSGSLAIIFVAVGLLFGLVFMIKD